MKKLILFFTAILFLSLSCSAAGKTHSTKNGEAMKISIQITSERGSHKLTATLSDNSSAKAFYQLLQKEPLVLNLNEYGGFEKVGPLGRSLPRNDRQIATKAGDIMLYQGNQVTIFYKGNSWSYSPLGKIDGMSQAELESILGSGNVTAVFTKL